MTYSGLPGVCLVSGKWILEDDNSADNITTLMTMQSQFINNWTSRTSKQVSSVKKQKTDKRCQSNIYIENFFVYMHFAIVLLYCATYVEENFNFFSMLKVVCQN